AKRTSPRTDRSQAIACCWVRGKGMSLVIEATAQSPARRVKSPASVRRKGRKVRRSVLRFETRGMAHDVARASSIVKPEPVRPLKGDLPRPRGALAIGGRGAVVTPWPEQRAGSC